MGLEAVSSGLKTRLETISDIKRVYASNELPSSINQFPSAIIFPGETNYDETMGALQRFIFRVVILLSKQDQPTALNRILDYIDPSGSDSVVAAVTGDPTLDSSCGSARVIRNLGLGSMVYGGIQYLSTEFEVEAYG